MSDVKGQITDRFTMLVSGSRLRNIVQLRQSLTHAFVRRDTKLIEIVRFLQLLAQRLPSSFNFMVPMDRFDRLLQADGYDDARHDGHQFNRKFSQVVSSFGWMNFHVSLQMKLRL